MKPRLCWDVARATLIALCVVTLCACDNTSDADDDGPVDNDTGPAAEEPLDVSTMFPDDGDMDVMEDTVITVKFNRALDPKTLTSRNFAVLDSVTRHPIRGRISYSAANLTAAFIPDEPLNFATHYTGRVLRNVTDAKGGRLIARVEWEFMVREFPLTKEIHTSPANDATGIALNTGVRVDFPTRLDPATVTPDVLSLRDASGAVVPGTLAYRQLAPDIAESIYFTPAADLSPNTRYTVTLSKSIATEAGKPLDQDVVWSYTTAAARTSTLVTGNELDDFMEGVAIDSANSVFTVADRHDIDSNQMFRTGFVVTKSDGAGNVLWEAMPDLPDDFVSVDVVVDSDDNPIAAGWIFDVTTGSDFLVVKFDGTNGDVVWTRQIGSPSEDYAYDLAVDGENNIYVAGITFGEFNGQTAAGNLDAVVLALDPDGADLWLTQYGSDADDEATTIAVNPAGDTVFVAGDTMGSWGTQTNAGGFDLLLSAFFAGDGTSLRHTLTGTANDEFAHSVAASSLGVYVDGVVINPMEFLGGTGLLIAFNPTGASVAWSLEVDAGPSPDMATAMQGIAVDATGGVYAAAWFEDPMGDADMPMAAVVYKLDATNQGAVTWKTEIEAKADNDMNHKYMPYAIPAGIALDGDGNVFVAGTVGNAGLVDGHVSRGRGDGFLVKLSPAGVIQ